jgi:hypothetical protein
MLEKNSKSPLRWNEIISVIASFATVASAFAQFQNSRVFASFLLLAALLLLVSAIYRPVRLRLSTFLKNRKTRKYWDDFLALEKTYYRQLDRNFSETLMGILLRICNSNHELMETLCPPNMLPSLFYSVTERNKQRPARTASELTFATSELIQWVLAFNDRYVKAASKNLAMPDCKVKLTDEQRIELNQHLDDWTAFLRDFENFIERMGRELSTGTTMRFTRPAKF